jgi:hypothetical protein
MIVVCVDECVLLEFLFAQAKNVCKSVVDIDSKSVEFRHKRYED